jgi:hypothetical protein
LLVEFGWNEQNVRRSSGSTIVKWSALRPLSQASMADQMDWS